jgi:hypothetical protein
LSLLLFLAIHVKAKMWPTFLHYLYWLYAAAVFYTYNKAEQALVGPAVRLSKG